MHRNPFALLVFVMLVTSGAGCKKAGPPPMPAVPVTAAEVVVRDQPIYIENIGQTLGAQDVEIRARVEGFLESVNFTEGTYVTSNTLLYTIDDRPFNAALAQAKGMLAQAQAGYDKARRDVNRLQPLLEKNAISRQQYDDALAAQWSAEANVNAAKATAETAEIQLGYTKIFAPIDGLIGKTEVKPGNLVGRGQSTLLTTMSSVDPIHIRISVSERDYLAWRHKNPAVTDEENATRDQFDLILADGNVHPYKGTAIFLDREIDPTTGTLLLEVSFPNPGRVVRPGQFGRVRLLYETVPGAILVPQRAVQELQANYSVFVVTPDSKVEFRKVTPGQRVGNSYVIASGLKPGEKIVVEGIQKLQNNTAVQVTMTTMADETAPSE